jgi:iron(III) transport system substrate-binding protein
VYVSEDQVFSEPILRDFEKETGIRVKAVYDTEEAKSAGVMNRLLAEKNNPQADVYWANEPIRAELLSQQGIAAAYQSPSAQGIPGHFKDPQGYWTGFSARARVLVVNKAIQDKPKSILAYANPAFKGKAVIANPLFGTTTTEIAALFTLWGDEKAKAFLADMKRNSVKVATSNGEAADFVASGQFAFALVDSDDAANRMTQGKPVEMIYPDQGKNETGCFIVPNAVVLINGSPHSEAGKKLVDYLLSRETERKLAQSDAAQIPLHAGVATPATVSKIESLKTMKIDYAAVARKMQEIQPLLKDWAGL